VPEIKADRNWSAEAKLAVVIEKRLRCQRSRLSEYCAAKGLYKREAGRLHCAHGQHSAKAQASGLSGRPTRSARKL